MTPTRHLDHWIRQKTNPKDAANRMTYLHAARSHWLNEARRFAANGDTDNKSYAQGRAAALNEVIVVFGWEGISLRLDEVENA